jgi:hypothetical protein
VLYQQKNLLIPTNLDAKVMNYFKKATNDNILIDVVNDEIDRI